MPAVTYSISLNGSPPPPEVLGAIQMLQVEDHANLADMLRLRVQVAPRHGISGWAVLDDDVFGRLTPLCVKVQVGSELAVPLIESYVIETKASLANEPGKSFLEVVAMDPTVLMSLDEKVRAWPNMSDSDIAAVVFGEHGFQSDVETTTVRYQEQDTTLMQRGTDIRFLLQLAQRNGYECFVELDERSGRPVGHFHKPRVDQTPQGVLSVNWGEATNVNRFEARFDMLRPVQAAASSLDIASQSSQTGQAREASLRPLGRGGTVDPNRPRRVLVSQTGLAQTAELQNYTQALVDESAFALLAEGELNTVAYGGLLRAKRAVAVRGAGRQFSGLYYVEKVQHTFTGKEYVQKFTLRRNALGLMGQEKFVEDRALPA
ncbi:MAG: hypothetical protein JXB13_07010 [Phycisphaerae bacterium]|nr:hypothetical protein [Phycisphaerae bacterium]